ncbi:copper chaperone [Aliiruegeria haliotis]|uniref:Copper chaperone n=1 Tax=Aliiruegeria haliotis TaxID=1280846 RepID=A0A2T0RTC8_9RHOB|nr:heavy-metal-associated domain-containing protein [Aliiruegeria haliotis]PRY24402.1 copper chaperone [Aliiruegeria haliotis]
MRFNVPEMSCGHCTAAIETALKMLDASADVTCDLEARIVSVTTTQPPEAIRTALDEVGFEATPV